MRDVNSTEFKGVLVIPAHAEHGLWSLISNHQRISASLAHLRRLAVGSSMTSEARPFPFGRSGSPHLKATSNRSSLELFPSLAFVGRSLPLKFVRLIILIGQDDWKRQKTTDSARVQDYVAIHDFGLTGTFRLLVRLAVCAALGITVALFRCFR